MKPDRCCDLKLRRLSRLPREMIVDTRALARVLGRSTRTIRRMVDRYEIPPPIRMSGRSTWQVGTILSWYAERAERRVSESRRVRDRLGG